MAWTRKARIKKIVTDAATATAEGRQVFACKLITMESVIVENSEEIIEWSMMIEAVEAEGWTLAHMAGSPELRNNRLGALCVFRPTKDSGY